MAQLLTSGIIATGAEMLSGWRTCDKMFSKCRREVSCALWCVAIGASDWYENIRCSKKYGPVRVKVSAPIKTAVDQKQAWRPQQELRAG
jgi:hypothetical protein